MRHAMRSLHLPVTGLGHAALQRLQPCAATRGGHAPAAPAASQGSQRSRQQPPAEQQPAGGDAAELLPHRRRAAATRAARAPPAPSPQQQQQQQQPDEPYPTFVPRNAAITDGPWNRSDAVLLQVALTEAQAAVTPDAIDASGYVLLGKSLEQLEQLVAQHKQPRFRAKQLLDGVLQGAKSVEEIATLPKPLREALAAAGVRTGRSILHHQVQAPCGTRKFLLQLHDGRVVETVGIPNDDEPTVAQARAEAEQRWVPEGAGGAGRDARPQQGSRPRSRLTVCVSSQVGCPMRCSFCATGKGGFARNLQPHEILDQVMTVQEQFGARVSNVVFMGMGEPLLNVPSVVRACHLLKDQLGLSARSVTISTVGVPNSIPRLAKEQLRATLAVSIHAPNQALRESIIPSAKAYPIEALVQDCTSYWRTTGRRVTFEYTLLSGVNDEPKHAAELAALLKAHDLGSHVNLIPWNPVTESEFARPSRNRVFGFVRALEAAGVTTTVRVTRGLEAAAACGQLRNEHQKLPLPSFAQPT